ncbi:hypothetical protein QUC31_013991 [Theobroma cacao]
MTWYAIIWAIWTTRNDMVFRGKIWDEEQTFELTKLKVVWWMNAKWLGHNASIFDLARFPNERTTPIKSKKTKKREAWTRLQEGCLKFNTDGASGGCPGDSSIGCILRNEHGICLPYSPNL